MTDRTSAPALSPGSLIPLLVGDTPVVSVRVALGGRTAVLRLKLESFNPCGSIKDRTAVSLFDSVADDLDPEAGLVESTSGNLGVALAALAAAAEIPFTAVVDPRTPGAAVHALHRLGATVSVVSAADGRGGYLLSRLDVVTKMIADRPTLRWTDQYRNPANPRAHEHGTAPELARQVGRRAVVLVPVSTGGTLAGMRRYAARATDWTVVGVDVQGSYALGFTAGRRLLPGIGSSLASSFVDPGDGPILRVAADDAVTGCLWLLEQTGIGVGASSGALIAGALRLIARDGLDDVVCVCPDGAGNYLDTVYSPAWRDRQGVAAVSPDASCESVEWDTP